MAKFPYFEAFFGPEMSNLSPKLPQTFAPQKPWKKQAFIVLPGEKNPKHMGRRKKKTVFFNPSSMRVVIHFPSSGSYRASDPCGHMTPVAKCQEFQGSHHVHRRSSHKPPTEFPLAALHVGMLELSAGCGWIFHYPRLKFHRDVMNTVSYV